MTRWTAPRHDNRIPSRLGYNERLFTGGVRKWIHEGRFLWLKRKCLEFKIETQIVLELGCFDARSIHYLPTRPSRYYGFDANWEDGLDSAKQIWGAGGHEYVFQLATKPEHLNVQEKVDLAISLETIEHIPPELIDGYLKQISGLMKDNGIFLATVPNEKGIIFLARYLAKRLIYGDFPAYSFREVLNATMGRMDKVTRKEHKGFDYMKLSSQLAKYFHVIRIEGVQFPKLPLWTNAQIGFVMRVKH